MAAVKFKNAKGVERGYEEGFGGIDLTASQKSGDSCAEISNLDIRADGALVTRSGYAERLNFSSPVRAAFTSGKDFYVLAGNEFTLTNAETDSTLLLGRTECASGEGDIFCYGGDIYLHDSQRLYRYDGESLSEPDGYAPLYGKGWHPSQRGSVCEELNILSNRIRVSYTTIASNRIYDVGLELASVDAVEVEGIFHDPSDYLAQVNGSKIELTQVTAFTAGIRITFWVTLAEPARKRNMLAQPSKAFVFSNSGGERLCICSPGISNRLLCSRPVSKAELYESRKSAPGSLELYLPLDSAILAGNGAYPITAIFSHFDRALLFTDANTWCVDYEGGERDPDRPLPAIFILNSAIGGEKIYGGAHFDNDPITFYRGRLFRWHSQSGVRDECSAELISDEIAELLPEESEHISMISLPYRGLIFFACADDPEGRLLVYCTVRRAWCIYRGIHAEKLFIYGSSPAFSRGEKIYVLTQTDDIDRETCESFVISSKLVTHYTDFGSPERDKRSVRILLDLKECASAKVTLTTEKGEEKSFDIIGSSGKFEERLSMPRFRKLRLTLEAAGKIHLNNLILSAK